MKLDMLVITPFVQRKWWKLISTFTQQPVPHGILLITSKCNDGFSHDDNIRMMIMIRMVILNIFLKILQLLESMFVQRTQKLQKKNLLKVYLYLQNIWSHVCDFSNLLHQQSEKKVLYFKWRNTTFPFPKILLKSIRLTKDYSLAIIPQFLTILVVPLLKTISFCYNTHFP